MCSLSLGVKLRTLLFPIRHLSHLFTTVLRCRHTEVPRLASPSPLRQEHKLSECSIHELLGWMHYEYDPCTKTETKNKDGFPRVQNAWLNHRYIPVAAKLAAGTGASWPPSAKSFCRVDLVS